MRSERAIEIVPAGEPEPALVEALAEDLRLHTGLPVVRGEALALEARWRGDNGAVRSEAVVRALMGRAEDGGGARWRLAMAESHLCGGEVGRVFGEAAPEHGCAVVAVAPMRARSGADADVLRARLLTGALHELGHLAGAGHCRRASCVMYPSLDIADTDRKGTAFCQDCLARVQWRREGKT